MIKVWGREDSSNVQAAMWAIAELGLAHERYDIGQRFGGNDTPEFLAMNPNGTVPVIRDADGPPLWETGCILRYLANTYGSDPFWPTTPQARATVDMWAEWAKLNIAQLFTAPVFWRVVRTAPSDQDPKAIAEAVAVLENKLQIAEDRLSQHEFLVGEAFTLADIQFGHVLFRYFDIDIARTSLPGLARYYQRLTERQAFRKHVMVSYEALRVT